MDSRAIIFVCPVYNKKRADKNFYIGTNQCRHPQKGVADKAKFYAGISKGHI